MPVPADPNIATPPVEPYAYNILDSLKNFGGQIHPALGFQDAQRAAQFKAFQDYKTQQDAAAQGAAVPTQPVQPVGSPPGGNIFEGLQKYIQDFGDQAGQGLVDFMRRFETQRRLNEQENKAGTRQDFGQTSSLGSAYQQYLNGNYQAPGSVSPNDLSKFG